MTSRKTRKRPAVRADLLSIATGALGPVPRCEIEVRPLTVLVGPQGSGKSLVAQLLYFFEELPYLLTFADAEVAGPRRPSADAIVRLVLDRLRSHERAFATFANPTVSVAWRRGVPYHVDGVKHAEKLGFRAYRVNRLVNPDAALRRLVSAVRSSKRRTQPRRAVFFPTERLVIAQLRTAIAEKVLSLPITYTLFSDWMERAAQVVGDWHGTPPTPEARWIVRRGAEALGGRAARWGSQWKWRFGSGRGETFDLDMASSGQRANWSLFYLAQALFELRSSREVARPVTLFMEEPEIHLHPGAQRAVAETLAFLVRAGFRVVVTTHSMNVLATFNNLVQASQLDEDEHDGVPEPGIRLRPEQVAVYAFGDGPPRSIVSGTGFIDEGELGATAEELQAGMNAIAVRLPPVEG